MDYMLYTTQTEPFEFHYTTKEALIQWAENLSVWIPIAHSKFPYQKTKRKAKTNDVDKQSLSNFITPPKRP